MFASLRGRMGILLLAFFLLVSVSTAATAWAIDTQKEDAIVINLAGRQRMLIQQMTTETLLIERGEGHASTLDETASIFDDALWAFIGGGEAPYLSGRVVTVPAAQDPEIISKLHEVHHAWDKFRAHLEVVRTASPGSLEFVSALEAVEGQSPLLIQKTDDVVRAFEAASAKKVARLRWIQASFFVSALALLITGSLAIRRLIINPLQSLALAADKIGRGDLSSSVQVAGSREISSLSRSFDTMREQLKESREDLKAWADELENRVTQRTRELIAVYEVSREISSRLDLNHVLRSVTDKARELLHGDVAALCLLVESGSALNLQIVSGPADALGGTQMLAEHLPAVLVLKHHEAIMCGASDCAGECGMIRSPYRVSHVAAPLRVGNRVIGALCVGSARDKYFSDEGGRFLTKLAASAGVALENARLYEQAERIAALEERHRIAAEMHDGLAQTLSYLDLKFDGVTALVETGERWEAIHDLQRMHEAVGQASKQVRLTIASLQEGAQPRRALQDRLSGLAAEFADDIAPPVELALEQPPPLFLPPDDTEQVLRVTREALLNAHRHAHAEHVCVRFETCDGSARVTVDDDGRGFDPQSQAANGGGHFGLSIMRARAARIGGQLEVFSAPGRGTRVMLAWPLDRTDTDKQSVEPEDQLGG